MRNPSRHQTLHNAVLSALLIALATGALSGCSATPAPAPSATPKPVPDAMAAPTDTTPVFASNDEALAAATEAYAAYASFSDDVMTHKTSPDNLTALSTSVSRSYLPQVVAGLANFTTAGHLGEGASTFDSIALIRYTDAGDGHAEVEVYMCSDVSGLRLFDASGIDVTPSDRLTRIPLQVTFVSSDSNSSHLLVDKENVWSGRNFC